MIVISDLFDEPDMVLKSLKSFRARKHELIVFQILDPQEFTFPFSETAVFQDMETDENLIVEPTAIRESYRKKFKAFLNSYNKGMLESRIDYEIINTAETFDRALFSYLQKRSRLL